MGAQSNIKNSVFVILEITTTFIGKEEIPFIKCIATTQKTGSLKLTKISMKL
tara:strand:- start:671 stop:826 length:156 start_codon:yes stop_codon:yes gene_type:complete